MANINNFLFTYVMVLGIINCQIEINRNFYFYDIERMIPQ